MKDLLCGAVPVYQQWLSERFGEWVCKMFVWRLVERFGEKVGESLCESLYKTRERLKNNYLKKKIRREKKLYFKLLSCK